MQSISSRIWIRIAVSNSYDDNNYTTGTHNIEDSLDASIQGLEEWMKKSKEKPVIALTI